MNKLKQFWLDLRSSLWFLPASSVVFAVALAVVLTEADAYIDRDVLLKWPRLFGAGADGARGLLTTVASSMITVVGVVFSITVVALSLASSQYTSRVLRNFMRDRVNQWVLGIMVGVFAYCLVVLRTIRGGDEGAFVPSVAVMGGLLLAFAGIVAFIFFIHHISISIQAAYILANVSRETTSTVERMYPRIAREHDVLPVLATEEHLWQKVTSNDTGYVESLDRDGLVRFAARHETVIHVEKAVGEFVIEGAPLFLLRGINVADEQEQRELSSFYTVGRQRTLEQDATFGIRQIVDIALKALSPGINDSTTAVMCLDYLTAILLKLGDRAIECRFAGDDGEWRLFVTGPTFASFADEALTQIRQSAGGNATVLEKLLRTVSAVGDRVALASRRQILRDHAKAVVEVAERTIASPPDRERLLHVAYEEMKRLGEDESGAR